MLFSNISGGLSAHTQEKVSVKSVTLTIGVKASNSMVGIA